MTEALTPAQKRTITRRANKAKCEYLDAEIARKAKEAAPKYTREGEVALLRMAEFAHAELALCRAYLAARGGSNREELRKRPVVALEDWRAAAVRARA